MSKKHTIYPFEVPPEEYPTWVESPPLAKAIADRIRANMGKKAQNWYCAGLDVCSEDKVFVNIYEMRNMVRGGVGNRIKILKPGELTEKERKMLDEEIEKQELLHAERELDRLEEEQRQQRIRALRAQMFPKKGKWEVRATYWNEESYVFTAEGHDHAYDVAESMTEEMRPDDPTSNRFTDISVYEGNRLVKQWKLMEAEVGMVWVLRAHREEV